MSFALHSTLDWISYLPDIVDKYNNTKHRTTKLTPHAASLPKNQKKLVAIYKKNNNRPRGVPKYKLNQPVRISRHSNLFTRGFEYKFSAEVFFIDRINDKIPITYILRDHKGERITGSFYEQELQKVSFCYFRFI